MRRIVIGNCMKPAKPFFSLVNLKKQDEYFVGDIIAFKGKNGLRYCHRIIKIGNGVFTTKGDNREVSKEYETNVPVENIMAKDCS